MYRLICAGLMFALALPLTGQVQEGSLEGYFTGRMVIARVDMPGSEKGIDLSFNKPAPMDWKEYSSRLNAFGVAIHKGQTARVTRIAVKKDRIEFHLDGGGFGAFGDDTNTTVSPVPVEKSKYEKDIEKQLVSVNDPKLKREMQNDLERERYRRERQVAANQEEASLASERKAQQVAAKRLQGGSRLNLRWQGSIPSDDLNPEAVMRLMAEYVDFDPSHSVPPAPGPEATPPPPAQGYSVQPADPSQLKRGMKYDEVASLLGQGRVMSQAVSNEGLRTQVIEFRTAESVVEVTFVEGIVVRYSINSR